VRGTQQLEYEVPYERAKLGHERGEFSVNSIQFKAAGLLTTTPKNTNKSKPSRRKIYCGSFSQLRRTQRRRFV